MTAHPVLIAPDGIYFAIMGQHPEWLCQPPCGFGIGRIALMINRKRRHKPLVQQIREKGSDLLGKKHAFINN